MTINDEILALANQIANDGKKPTVALIKAKLTKRVPLPAIISTLRNWQHQPDFITLPKNDEQVELASNEPTSSVDSLKLELKQLKLEIAELKQVVNKLVKQQKVE